MTIGGEFTPTQSASVVASAQPEPVKPPAAKPIAPAPRPLPPPAPAAPPVKSPDKPVQVERRAPFAPDILGLRLDVPLADVDAALRSKMTVQAVINNVPTAWGFAPRVLTARVYVGQDATDRLAIFWVRDSEPRVVAITRSLALSRPAPAKPDLEALVGKKWGTPVGRMGALTFWSADQTAYDQTAGACTQIGTADLGNGFSFTEGRIAATPSRPFIDPGSIAGPVLALPRPLASANPDDLLRLKRCPTVGWIYYNPDAPEPSMQQGLFDGSLIASVLNKGASPAESLSKADALINGR
jgi:hypothetical protein